MNSKQNKKSQLLEKQDIKDLSDIKVVLSDFYSKAFGDPIIGFMFTDIAKANLGEHVEDVAKFWLKSLFNEGEYKTNVLKKHIDLDAVVTLKAGHFTRWLYLFEKALDANFSGKTAENMRKRAYMVADSINSVVGKASGRENKSIESLNQDLIKQIHR